MNNQKISVLPLISIESKYCPYIACFHFTEIPSLVEKKTYIKHEEVPC